MIAAARVVMKKNLISPDETRNFPNGRIEVVKLGDATVGRISLRPGWRWSKDVKPTVNTSSCQVSHLQYVMNGKLHVKMDDGTELELKAGDAAAIPPGHDAWVVGDDPFTAIEFEAAATYAKAETPSSPSDDIGEDWMVGLD